MTDPADLGRMLRRQRERRGVSLQDIAFTTKISSALLADLERGDLSRWPPGLYGRAFIRSYAEAVGLEPHDVVSGFLHLIPTNENPFALSPGHEEQPSLPGWSFEGRRSDPGPSSLDGVPLRLTFAEPEASVWLRVPRWGRRIVASAADATILLAGAAIGLLTIGPDGWLAGLTVAALIMVVLASAVLGTTPGWRLFCPSTDLRDVRHAGHAHDRLRLHPFDRRGSSEPSASKQQ
jgi:transcriptional regulator with XRE-family HTH domain